MKEILDAKINKVTITKVSKSCDHCKLKKVKCDQARPICQNCSKYEVSCIYSVMKKPGLKTGYGQHVFEKINLLNNLVDMNKKQQESDVEIISQRLKYLEQRLEVVERRTTDDASALITSNPLQTFTRSESFTDPGSFREVMPDSLRHSSDMSVNGSLKTRIGSMRSEIVRSNHIPIKTENEINNRPNSEGLPPDDQVLALVEIYFKYVNPIFPVLHYELDYPKLIKKLNLSNVLLVAVLLNALKFSGTIISPDSHEFWYNSLLKTIISSCYAIKNIEELRLVTLAAFSLYGRSKNHEAWSLISLAVGGCLHLGITKDPTNADLLEEENNDLIVEDDWQVWSKNESLRVLLWEIYKLDRLSSISSHFICKLPENELTCFLPIRADLWRTKSLFDGKMIEKELGQNKTLKGDNKQLNPNLYGSNCYIIEVINLMEECLSFRKTPMDIKDMKGLLAWQLTSYNFEIRITAWKNSLPEYVSDFLQNANIPFTPSVEDIILFTLYHTLILRLHSPVAFSKFLDIHPIPAQTSKGICLQSANSILELSKALSSLFDLEEEEVYGLFGPYYAFSVWVCGRIFLVNAICNRGQLDENFEQCISILKKMGVQWECATKFADILEFFQDDTLSLDGHSVNGTGESGIGLGSQYSEDAKLIADLKLNATSLDTLLSRKINKFKAATTFDDDLLVFDWFKLPLNQSFLPDST